ncbi:MAG: thiamine pyrophosphate-binding protein [Gemmatimonadota bacterium]|nr:thiamine pyrophosphate-binding protein [Gemmatimonadota bacterium]
MPRLTGGRFIAETVHGYGITHVFYMPVIAPRALMEMERLGIRRIMTHGEKSAAYMADAYARVRRGAGICMAQSVGAANLAAGLQDAYLACSPVIAITGRQTQINRHRHAYQEVDHVAPFDAVTKYNVLVDQPEQLPYFLRQAFREATTATPGPVHLDMAGFIGDVVANAEADLDVVAEEPFAKLPPFRPEPEPEAVRRAIDMLAAAERPIIVAGGGIVSSGAGDALRVFAEKLSIPVATSLNAKEAFPYDHPLAVGVCGLYSRECANRAVCEADLVFFVGSHTGGQVTNDWTVPPAGTQVIQLDVNPAEIGRSYPIRLGIQADARAGLSKLVDAAPESVTRSAWTSRVRQLTSQWRESVAPYVNSDEVPIRPERLCRELTRYLPSDAILVSDTGHSGIWTGTLIDLTHPGQSYIRCSGSLGWGIPAAVGARCAAPDRPVICFTGDGGIWYHVTELDTAVRNDVPVVVVVNNNHSLNQEKGLNEDIYGGPEPGSDELWHMTDGDFAKMAESMDCLGITVRRAEAFGSALDEAIGSGKPAVIDVKTHVEGIAPPAWSPPA